jgi:hypothetical protein
LRERLVVVLRRLSPYLLLTLLGLVFFGPLVQHPTGVLYSPQSDLLAMHLPAKWFLVRSWHETGELPLWNPYSYAGTPFVHDVQVGMFYPLHWPLLLLPEEQVGAFLSWLVVLHVVIAGWCTYACARAEGLGSFAALVAAMGYMFAGKWLLHLLALGHTIMAPLAWLPLAALWLNGAVRHGSLLRATAAGVAFALIALAAHPQMTLYAGLFLALWSLGPALEQAGWVGTERAAPRRTAAALARWLGLGAWTAVVASALSAVQILPALEATPLSTRGSGVAAQASLQTTIDTLLRLIGPPLTSMPRWELQGGLGAAWVMAALAAPLLVRGRVRYQALVALALVVLALGGAALFQHLPVVRLFQIPARLLMIAGFPIAFLTGAATQAMIDGTGSTPAPRQRQTLLLAVRVGVVGLAAVPVLLTWRSGVRLVLHPYWLVCLVTIPLAFVMLRPRPEPASRLGTSAWLVLLLADLWALSRPFVDVRAEADIYPLSECLRALVAQKAAYPSPWRVLDRGLPDRSSSGPVGVALPMHTDVRLPSVLGYNTFDVLRTKEYLQWISGKDEPIRPRQNIFGFPIVEPFPIESKKLLDLLGVRYAAVSDELPERYRGQEGPGAHPGWKVIERCDDRPVVYSFLEPGMTQLAPQTIYENTEVFPRAFVVARAVPLPDRARVREALQETDLRQVVLLEAAPQPASDHPSSPLKPAALLVYTPNRVEIDVEGLGPGILVLTEVMYPGWRCSIDGASVPIRRADYLFRGVELPAGARRALFTFEPDSLARGAFLSEAALAVVVMHLLIGAIRARTGAAARG